jgi:NhaA family Na+:H+ antiporter
MIKKKVREITKHIADPFERFLRLQSSGGLLLIIATIIAMVWSNSVYSTSYFAIWEHQLSINYASFQFSKSLHWWINDGLMAIFFFVVGLEIKREVVAGELSTAKEAIFPIVGAIGGMLAPIIIFLIVVGNGVPADGWGVPMATDIAFALGVLSLLGKKVPLALKVFLTALAIVDDIGALIVIALFYSNEIYWTYLQIAGGLFVLLFVFNYFNLRIMNVYLLTGIVIWFCFVKSGIHPTIAGVLLALTIPTSRKIRMDSFIERANAGLKEFQKAKWPDSKVVLTIPQINAIETIKESVTKVQSPIYRLENSLGGFVTKFAMPLFALANASIVFGGGNINYFNQVTLAVGIALLLGKVIGISLFSWISVKLGFAKLPNGVSWIQIIGVGILSGIGFTMSLFITNLAFTDDTIINQFKIGIFTSSFLAGLIGFIILKRSLK